MSTPRISRLWARRRGLLLTLVGGAALSALMGSGLFAVVVDANRSTGNQADAGVFSGVHNIELAVTTESNDTCSGVTWQKANVTAATVVTVSLDDARVIAPSRQDRICVRKFRDDGPVDVFVTVVAVVETETSCTNVADPPEQQVDPDSCGGGLGELGKVLNVGTFVRQIDDAGATCSQNLFAPRPLYGAKEGATPRFNICRLRSPNKPVSFFPFINVDQNASVTDLARAQSDRVQFSYEISFDR